MNVPVLLPKFNTGNSPMMAKISWRRIVYPSVHSLPTKLRKSLLDDRSENVKKYIVYHIKKKNGQNQTLIDDDPMNIASSNRRTKKRIYSVDLDKNVKLISDKNVSLDFDEYNEDNEDEPNVLLNKSTDERLEPDQLNIFSDFEPFEDIKSEILIRPMKEFNNLRSKLFNNGKSVNKKNNYQSEAILIRHNTSGHPSLTNRRQILNDEETPNENVKNDKRMNQRKRRKRNHFKTSQKFLKIVNYNFDQ